MAYSVVFAASVAVLLIVVGQKSSLVEAQMVGFGKCPVLTLQANFQAASYLGVWYEIRRYPMVFEAGSKCSQAQYSLLSEGASPVIQVNNTATKIKGNTYTEVVGHAYAPDPVNNPAKLVVNFPSSGPFLAPYWVVSTDYVNYSVVYTCTETLGFKTEFSWILSRTTNLTAPIEQQISTVLKQNSINANRFLTTKQEGCVNY